MTLLRWRTAERGDRALLQDFSCTEPAVFDAQRRRAVHPKPWELVVQSGIRNLKPPTGGQFVLLGLDDDGIGAVCIVTATEEPAEFYLMAVAVARHYRGRDGFIADEAITQALEVAADRSAQEGHENAYIFGYIHEENVPSQRMCERRGFTHEGDSPLKDYQQWSITVDLSPAPSVPSSY